jgi:hypothetical protein
VLGVHRLGGALGRGGRHRLVEPDVAPLAHRAGRAGVAHDEDGLDRRGVERLLDRRRAALAARAVDGDQRLGLRRGHPLDHRLGRKAAEDDVVRRPDACAGEHRDDHLGDHREMDPDDVARADPAVLERVGQALDVAQQVGVGDRALLALLAAPVERHALPVARQHVAVDAVVGRVQPAPGEPAIKRRLGLVEHRAPRLGPVERPGLRGPEALVIARRRVVDRRVGDQRARGELRRRREALDRQQRVELVLERHQNSPSALSS